MNILKIHRIKLINNLYKFFILKSHIYIYFLTIIYNLKNLKILKISVYSLKKKNKINTNFKNINIFLKIIY